MKRCSRCGETTDNFARSSKAKDGFQSWCKTCVKEHSHDRYQRLKPLRRQQAKDLIAEYRVRLNQIKAGAGCADCGISDWRVLDFDHLGGKVANIADLVQRYSWERILQETEKCEVVCANCHRIRTHARRQAVR